MPKVTWSAPSAEASIGGNAAMASRTDGSTTLLGDIANTTGRDCYLSLRAVFGSVTPAAGGTVTFALRRKTGGAYAENNEVALTMAPTGIGARSFELAQRMMIPPFTFGLYLINALGTTTAATGNDCLAQLFSEESN